MGGVEHVAMHKYMIHHFLVKLHGYGYTSSLLDMYFYFSELRSTWKVVFKKKNGIYGDIHVQKFDVLFLSYS